MGNLGHGHLKGEGMNTQNVGSLEACKRLADSGIVLETEAIWSLFYNGWRLVLRTELHPLVEDYPAPSMAEVWRELPRLTHCIKQDSDTKCVVEPSSSIENIKVLFNENPTDALIDLLIWVRKGKP